MEIKGKVIEVLDTQQGVSKSGKPWKKKEYVIETYDTYPRKVCFAMMNDNADKYPLRNGQDVIVHFDINANEYNGRWYNSINGWKIEYINSDNTQPGTHQSASAADDDMPF